MLSCDKCVLLVLFLSFLCFDSISLPCLQLSEVPYRPFRSPSREDLPAEPIPEVEEGAAEEEEVLLVVKQLDTELKQMPTTHTEAAVDVLER